MSTVTSNELYQYSVAHLENLSPLVANAGAVGVKYACRQVLAKYGVKHTEDPAVPAEVRAFIDDLEAAAQQYVNDYVDAFGLD